MPWESTSQSALAAAAGAALAAAFPRAVARSYDPRPVPPGSLPAFAVAIEPSTSTADGLASAARLVDGTIRVALWSRAAEIDRDALAALADVIDGVMLNDAELSALTGALDPADREIEVQGEADRFARIECTYAAQWLESPSIVTAILTRFGLA